MNRLTCATCHDGIPNGEALVRSRSLAQVAFHRSCYHPAPVVIPEQRRPTHDDYTPYSAADVAVEPSNN